MQVQHCQGPIITDSDAAENTSAQADDPSALRPAKPPRWYLLTPFLGRPPPLTARQWQILGLVSAVSFFEQYDLYLFALNLKQIQADLGIAEESLGLLGSVVRSGALLALFFGLAADRLGRRRLLLWTVLGYTLLTGATALAPSTEWFVILQFLARGFAQAETMLAAVVIIEEFDARYRGWGIGALGAIQACGAGAAAVMFGFVEVIPYGWRSLYAFGLVPLLLIAWWRRSLPETQRFTALSGSESGTAASGATSEARDQTTASIAMTGASLSVLGELIRMRRFWAVCTIVLLLWGGTTAPVFFAPKYLQDVHFWSPGDVAMLTFFGGAFAIIGNPLAGWLSDRFGRRRLASIFPLGFAAAAAALFMASGSGILPVVWILLIFFSMGGDVTVNTASSELFPTRIRSSATAAGRVVVSTLGGMLGLGLVSVLYPYAGSNWMAVVWTASLCLFVPILVLALLPETAGRSLERINDESQT